MIEQILLRDQIVPGTAWDHEEFFEMFRDSAGSGAKKFHESERPFEQTSYGKRKVRPGRTSTPEKLFENQLFQLCDIPSIVAWLLNRSFGDERRMRETQIVEQDPKWFPANASFSNLLMAVEFRTARRLGVIAMNHLHVIQPDRGVEFAERLI
jgi:hypothetical protein